MAQLSPRSRLRWLAIGCGALVLTLVLSALFVDGGVARHERLHEELARLKTLNDDLEQDNSRLRREVEALKHDARYVERVAREELGLVQEDEVIFIVPSASEEEKRRE